MGRLRIFQHITLDGVIQHSADENGYPHGDWSAPYRGLASREALLAAQGQGFDLLLGRRTYDIWSGHWPQAPRSPMADALRAATKFVVTHRAEGLDWGPALALGPQWIDALRHMKATRDRDLILWGSSTLTSPLLEQGLADEVLLIIYPVVLGIGKRLLASGSPPRALELLTSQVFPAGHMLNTYKVAGALKDA